MRAMQAGLASLSTALLALQSAGGAGPASGGPAVIRVSRFGAEPDGRTDCGEAVARAVAAAAARPGPVRIIFDRPGVYRILHAPNDVLISLKQRAGVTVDGGGNLLLLHPRLDVFEIVDSSDITIRNFCVDCDPLPFCETCVVGMDPDAHTLDVRPLDGFPAPPADPTPVRNPHFPFFGMLWKAVGPGEWLEKGHVFIDAVTAVPNAGAAGSVVRVLAARRSWPQLERVAPGKDRFTLPVRGLAHAGRARFRITGSKNVAVENVDVWASPYFCFYIQGNEGRVVFRRVNIMPKPGTQRLTSAWRDGFHVKDNRAELLWEECRLQGLQDDAFNISSMTWRVEKVLAPERIIIRQVFPHPQKWPKSWRPGDPILAYSVPKGRVLGRARLRRAEEADSGPNVQELVLDAPIPGIDHETVVWNEALCNPHNTIRNCTIIGTARLRCPLTIEGSRFRGLLWFYGDTIEGPLPRHIRIRDCFFEKGKGNPRLVLATGSDFRDRAGRRIPMQSPDYTDFVMENVRIHGGDVNIQNWTGFRITDVRIDGGIIELHEVREPMIRNVFVDGLSVDRPENLPGAAGR